MGKIPEFEFGRLKGTYDDIEEIRVFERSELFQANKLLKNGWRLIEIATEHSGTLGPFQHVRVYQVFIIGRPRE